MLKKFLLVFLVLFALFSCSAAMAEPRLVTIHESVVNYVFEQIASVDEGQTDFSGDVSFDTARFLCLTVEVAGDESDLPVINPDDYMKPKLSFSSGNYSYWNGEEIKNVNNSSMSFDVIRSDSLWNFSGERENYIYMLSSNKLNYLPTATGYNWFSFVNSADNGLANVNATLIFPEILGSEQKDLGTIPALKTTQEQLEDFVPYLQFVTTGTMGNGDLQLSKIELRIVSPDNSNVAIKLSDDVSLELVGFFDGGNFTYLNKTFNISADNELSVDVTPDEGTALPRYVLIRYYIGENKDEIYQWRFSLTGENNLKDFQSTSNGAGYYGILAGLKNGKADYTYAHYNGTDVSSIGLHPDLVEAKYLVNGKLTIHGGGKFSLINQQYGFVVQSFDQTEDIELTLYPYGNIGDSMANFSHHAAESVTMADGSDSGTVIAFMDPEGSLAGKKLSWTFPDSVKILNGEGVIQNSKTLEEQFDTTTGFFPYIEYTSDDQGRLTSITYRIVQSPDISKVYDPGVACGLNVHVDGDGGYRDFSNCTWQNWEENFMLSGTWTLDEPLKLGYYTSLIVTLNVFKIPFTQDNYFNHLTDAGYQHDAKNSTTYVWLFTEMPPIAEINQMNESETANMSEDKIVEAVDEISSSDSIHVVDYTEVFEESEANERIVNYLKDDESELVGRFRQLYATEPGWVVTKVTLADEMFDSVKGVSADNLMVYSVTEDDLNNAEIARNKPFTLFATPAFAASATSKTGKLVNLDGSKLDTINSKELLMVSYLKAGQKSNMYLGLNASATSATPSGETKKDEEGKETNNNSAVTDNTTKDTVKDEGTETPSTQADTVDNVADDNTQDTQADNTGTNIPSGFDPSTGTFTTSANDTRTLEEIIAALGDNIVNVTSFKLNSLTITKLDSANLAKFINLTSLDLTGASALTEITLGSGSKIQFLNVAKNTAIQTISLAGSSIKDLDTNACTNLTSLNLGNCKNLKTLNTKGCKNLKVLILSGCEKTLTTLNIKGNSLLLIDLSNFGSQLTSLDVSGQVRDNLKVGKKINLKEFFNTSNDYSGNVTISEATNTSGDVLEWKITSGEIEFNGVPDKFKYYFNTGFTKITADFFASASSNDVSMDVSITSDGTTVDDEGVLGSSGGGCNLGIGIFVLSLLGVLINLSVKH